MSSPALGKRARTRARILANAIALFRRDGVRRTRLADVARATEIAPATLFNHFPTRAQLAGAWVRGEIDACAAEALGEEEGAGESDGHAGDASRPVAAAERAPRNLRVGLRGLCRALAERNAGEVGSRLEAWREADRLRPGAPPPALVAAIEHAQRTDRIRGDRSALGLADLLLDAVEGGLIEGLRAEVDATDPEAIAIGLRSRLQDRVDLVLDGLRKKNERVRWSAAGPSGPGPEVAAPAARREGTRRAAHADSDAANRRSPGASRWS